MNRNWKAVATNRSAPIKMAADRTNGKPKEEEEKKKSSILMFALSYPT